MGIVADAAGRIPGVFARDDLRERFGFGGIRLMAGHAEFCGVGKDGFLAGEVLRVASERPMAGFASDIGVRTFAFRGGDVVVAGGAGLAAGEDRSTGGDFIEGSGAVISVLAELRGNESVADCQESQDENNRDERQPDQVLPAFENYSHAAGYESKRPTLLSRFSEGQVCKGVAVRRVVWWAAGGSGCLRGMALTKSEALS